MRTRTPLVYLLSAYHIRKMMLGHDWNSAKEAREWVKEYYETRSRPSWTPSKKEKQMSDKKYTDIVTLGADGTWIINGKKLKPNSPMWGVGRGADAVESMAFRINLLERNLAEKKIHFKYVFSEIERLKTIITQVKLSASEAVEQAVNGAWESGEDNKNVCSETEISK